MAVSLENRKSGSMLSCPPHYRQRLMNAPLTTQIIEFLRSIGLAVVEKPIAGATVLPGIDVDRGTLVVDRTALKYPGDLLHEAGHLAVVPSREREQMHANVGDDGGMEMAAIAWSYAAAVHLGLSPSVVFHPDGYRGEAASLLDNFVQGRYFGVPLLVWRGLTDPPTPPATSSGAYPLMKRWLTE